VPSSLTSLRSQRELLGTFVQNIAHNTTSEYQVHVELNWLPVNSVLRTALADIFSTGK
jgi:hypothetical protein